jgi:hypothetical protein
VVLTGSEDAAGGGVVSALDGVDAERVVAVAGFVPDVVAEVVIDVVVAVPTVAVLNSSR